MILRRLPGYSFFGCLLVVGLLAMVGCNNSSYIKRSVKGPLVRDGLRDGASVGVNEKGFFTKTGWQPGKDGSLTYTLPTLEQGMISMEVTGLSRTDPDTILLTLFEEPEMNYVEPFIAKNPYLVTLTAMNFQSSPESPFEFLWTIKTFPLGTADKDRYVDGLPSGVPGYQKSLPSKPLPILSEKVYTIQIQWLYGKARLIVDGEIMAEHDYKPLLRTTKNLRLVIGKSPLAQTFGAENITISNVWISYPTIYDGSL